MHVPAYMKDAPKIDTDVILVLFYFQGIGSHRDISEKTTR